MFKKLVSISLVAIMLLTGTVYASPISNNEMVSNEMQYLQSELNRINNLNVTDIKSYYMENEFYLKELDSRLAKYLNQFNSEVQTKILSQLMDENNSAIYSVGLLDNDIQPMAGTVNNYFSSWKYHYRNGYWTYSISPYTSTRLLRTVASEGWDSLADRYSGIRYDNGSLSDQYWCHFEAFIEADWDIEEGRPNVGFAKTVLAFCNPE